MADKSDLACVLPEQCEELAPGAAAIEVWAGELDGHGKTVVLCCKRPDTGQVWVHAHMTAAQARVLARAFAEAAEDLEPDVKADV